MFHSTPSSYVLQAMADPAQEDRSAAQSVQGTQVFSGVAQPGDEGGDTLSGEAARWAQCMEAAPPRVRNRSEIEVAYEEIKQNFYNSSDHKQKFQDDVDAGYNSTDRKNRQRGRFKVYLKQTFGHHNAVFDYLETGEMPPLYTPTPPLPLGDRVLHSEQGRRSRRRLS